MGYKIQALIVIQLMIMLPVVSAWQIGGVTETDITHESATIAFNTQDEPTTARIDYGEDGNFGTHLIDSNEQTDHTFNLQNLDPSTAYYYKLTATDANAAQQDKDRDFNGALLYFETTGAPDTTAPVVVDDVQLSLPSDDTAVVSWTTDEASDTHVYWGERSDDLNNSYKDPAYSTAHSASMSVTVGKRYFYRIASCDEDGNCVNYTQSSFTFVAGQDNTAPFLSVDVPDKWGTTTLTLNGSTEPHSSVFMYIDGSLRSQKQSDAEGDFRFDVSIASYSESIIVKFVILDQVGFTYESEEYPILINFDPPTLILDDTPEKSNTSTLTLSGSVEPLCDVEFKVSGGQDQTAPAIVENVKLKDVGTNSVELEWNENRETDILEYLIYRDGTPIATTHENEFIDTGPAVGSGETYAYQIAAVDETCNIGPKSGDVIAETLQGGMEQSYEPDPANTTCDNSHYVRTARYQGAFSDTVSLQQGLNYVQVSATNEFGNTVKVVREIDVDTEVPEIEEDNLDALASGPSYNREITIEGRVSEPATVYVYLNNDTSPSDSCVTDPNNEFSCDVRLEMRSDLSVDAEDSTETTGSYELGYTFENRIKLVAEDVTGKRGPPVEQTLIYAQCSHGSWFTVDFHDQTPDMIAPRLMIEGAAQIGLSVDVKWNAGTFTNATIRRNPKLYKRSLSLEDEKEWDKGWISESITCKKEARDHYQCYISLKIPAIDPAPDEENWTMFEKEENLSNHRLGECPVPDMGCIKVPLVLETEFELLSQNGTQKQVNCLDVYAYIDKRIPPDNIPEEFLEDMVVLLNDTINAIDAVLEPLRNVRVYTFGACMALYGVDFLMTWKEKFRCEFNDFMGKVEAIVDGQDASWKIGVARTGQCEEVYRTDQQESAQENCLGCEEAIESRMKVTNLMKWTCDRMFCPSAPSFQYFHEQSEKKLAGTASKRQKIVSAASDLQSGNEPGIDFNKYEDASYSYDCALVENPARYLVDYDPKDMPQESDKCEGLHIPSKECCKTSYLERWDSACWIMDEFHESACLDAKYSANPSKVGEGPDARSCNVLWNAAAGFCDPMGGPKAEIIQVNRVYVKPDCLDDESLLDGSEIKSNLFFRVMPELEGEDVKQYYIQPGYISTGISLSTPMSFENPEESSPINEQREFIPYESCGEEDNYADYFYIPTGGEGDGETYEQRLDSKMDQFQAELGKIGCKRRPTRSGGYECEPLDSDRDDEIDDAYEQIQDVIGTSAKKYVVDPPSTFARSLQCVCINAIYEYLVKYRNIMQVVQNCFQTILLTGDGSAGMCREVISVYICDALYDLIKCFSSKYAYGGGRGAIGGSIGNFLGSMGSAAGTVSDRVNSRYGGNQLFNAALGENKVAHSICMFAFTGTWDLDPATLLDTQSGMPVESTGAIYPCERRFISYNQANNGYATWAYSVAGLLVAGADLTWSIDLVCSDSLFGCDVQEGFPGGSCDCVATGQKTQRLSGGTLNQRDTLNEDFFKTFESKVRYDKAVLRWSYIDNNGNSVTQSANCTIQQKGGNPPAFCNFDPGTGTFRCDFNMGQESYARFTGEATPLYDNGQYFRLDEMMSFEIPVTFKKPQESDCTSTYCEYTKFIFMDIKDQHKNSIGSCEFGPVDIFQEGTHSIPADTCKLTSSLFTSSSIDGLSTSRDEVNDAPNSVIREYPPIPEVKVVYLIYKHRDGDEAGAGEYYSSVQDVYTSLGKGDLSDPAQKLGYVSHCEKVSGVHLVECDNGYQFRLGHEPGYSWALTHELTPSVGSCNPNTDMYFYYDLYMYNSRDDGGSYSIDLNSLASYEGETQKKENQKFKVRCTETTAAMDPDRVVECPDPMYDSWDDSGLGGQSRCECGDTECNLDDAAHYCVAGECVDQPLALKDCEQNMQSLDEYQDEGVEPKCICQNEGDATDEICSKKHGEYCVKNGADSLFTCSIRPICKLNQKVDIPCYCEKLDDGYNMNKVCERGWYCNGDGTNNVCADSPPQQTA